MAVKTSALWLLLLSTLNLCAQQESGSRPESFPMISFTYGFYIPGGTMDDRFGENSAIGMGVHFKTAKNYLLGVEGSALFGRLVYEPGLLQNLLSENKEILDEQSRIAEILLFERGYTLSLNAGKVVPVKGFNSNSGILFKGGFGFMQHKIRIEHQNHRIPQLEGDYIKGYDRLSNGFFLNEFIGLFYMGNNGLANFFGGIDLYQGFTTGRRDLHFDTGKPGTDKRLDLLFGFKIGWNIPVYKRTATGYYVQ